jgi:hypothetical protein
MFVICRQCGAGNAISSRLCVKCRATLGEKMASGVAAGSEESVVLGSSAHAHSPSSVSSEGTWLHLLWYIPLCLVVVATIIVPSGILAFENIRYLCRHFTWGLLVSPSCVSFLGLTVTSIMLPLGLLSSITTVFEASTSRKLLYSARTVALTVGLSVVIQIVIWGSYPLGSDANGMEHIRMIPFFPWPQTSFLQWIWPR